MPPAMRLGNWALSRLFGLLFRYRLGDTQCGMRAFPAAAYPQLCWEATGYAVETEMLVNAARARLRVAQIGIETVYLDAYKGTTIGDGLKVLGEMLRLRLTR
jgi:hypothetical protein